MEPDQELKLPVCACELRQAWFGEGFTRSCWCTGSLLAMQINANNGKQHETATWVQNHCGCRLWFTELVRSLLHPLISDHCLSFALLGCRNGGVCIKVHCSDTVGGLKFACSKRPFCEGWGNYLCLRAHTQQNPHVKRCRPGAFVVERLSGVLTGALTSESNLQGFQWQSLRLFFS